MGDNGHIYPTYTRKMCRDMKRLIQYADIITPNLTEACFLTDTPYKPNGWRHTELVVMARELMAMGAKRLVITGIKMGENFIGNVVGEQNGDVEFQRQMIVEDTRSGTGDVFASVLGADAVNGVPFALSAKRASHFVRQCLIETLRTPGPANTGIDFESCLWQLRKI